MANPAYQTKATKINIDYSSQIEPNTYKVFVELTGSTHELTAHFSPKTKDGTNMVVGEYYVSFISSLSDVRDNISLIKRDLKSATDMLRQSDEKAEGGRLQEGFTNDPHTKDELVKINLEWDHIEEAVYETNEAPITEPDNPETTSPQSPAEQPTLPDFNYIRPLYVDFMRTVRSRKGKGNSFDIYLKLSETAPGGWVDRVNDVGAVDSIKADYYYIILEGWDINDESLLEKIKGLGSMLSRINSEYNTSRLSQSTGEDNARIQFINKLIREEI